MSTSLEDLKARTTRIVRLGQTMGLVGWDQQTYMPPGASAARAEQTAVLSELIHGLMAGDETGTLLQNAEQETAGADPDSDDVRLLAVIRRDYDHATKLPASLVEELARCTALAHETWVNARAANDFASFAPALEQVLELTRQQAEHLGYKDHIFDALVDLYEPGSSQAQVAAMFADVKPHLVSLTQAIATRGRANDDSILRGNFPVPAQRALTLGVVGKLGFDLSRGRQDEAAHPFCSSFSRDDVRLTTRFDTGFLPQAFYASMHEAGHGLYEQNSGASYEGTMLAGGASLGVHESQSRLWENLVGRSREFTHWVFPQLREVFPDAFGSVDPEDYYRAINKVKPSFIRVEADEVTYNLHILLRFELECDLLTGALAVRDLPEAWNAKMRDYFGITPPTDSDGVLQDVHWSSGGFGYFPTYSIGNLLSAQLWNAAAKSIGDLPGLISHGDFAPLLAWLRENVHQYGQKYLPGELVKRATGEPLSSRAYVDYLTRKYADIYSL